MCITVRFFGRGNVLKKYELNGKRGNESKTNTQVHLVAMYSFLFLFGVEM